MDILVTVLLAIFATVLLVVEVVFIPGFGFTGFAGLVAMAGSIFYAFAQIGNAAGWITILVMGMVCISLFLWALYGNSLDKVALNKNIDSTVRDNDVSTLRVGQRGVAKTRLALIGEALFDGRVFEVKSESGLIDEDDEIEIIRISGDTLFVAKVGKK
ncbi:MAG: nodulation efficiency protein D (NfeD) [Bacteroidaceae bacterium]|nr:nodulation efficiency protein D (NfeD) [Bacteroidaceae bacterium]